MAQNTTIFGAIGLPESDDSFVSVIGQQLVYDATKQMLGDHNADVDAASAFFIEKDTSDFKIRYRLDGQGRLQKMNRFSRAAAVKAAGSWDCSFPLEEWGASIETTRVDMAYLTMQEWAKHLNTVTIQNTNTVRQEILYALLHPTDGSFIDQLKGTLTIKHLANGTAGELYPPVVGTELNAAAIHYLGTATDLSTTFNDTTNPLPAGVSKLENRFGLRSGGSNVVAFINNAQVASVQALASFVEYSIRAVSYGDNVSTLEANFVPPGLPGITIGWASGALIQRWDWIPAGYIYYQHLDAPKPLMRRVDPAKTGLSAGLQMVAEDAEFPFRSYTWSNRFGLACGNRLNGVAQDIIGHTTYTVPTAFA